MGTGVLSPRTRGVWLGARVGLPERKVPRVVAVLFTDDFVPLVS